MVMRRSQVQSLCGPAIVFLVHSVTFPFLRGVGFFGGRRLGGVSLVARAAVTNEPDGERASYAGCLFYVVLSIGL